MQGIRQVSLSAFISARHSPHAQALTNLRVELDKNVTRGREAELETRLLETQLQDKDEQLASLRTRLESTRRIIDLRNRWDSMRRKLGELEER